MTQSIREHACPNCGAPLGIPEKHDRFFKCSYCGTVLEDHASEEEQETGVFKIKISKSDIDAAQEARLQVYSTPPVITSYTPTDNATGSRIGCAIAVFIFLVVGAIVAAAVLPGILATGALIPIFREIGSGDDPGGFVTIGQDSGLGGVQLFSYGPAAMIPSDDDTSPDVVGVANASDSKNLLTYVDFERQPALRWMAEVTGDGATFGFNRFAADASRLYYSYGSQVVAYNRENGSRIWETSLQDEIQHTICTDCFQLIGDALVTLSADGTLAAWEPETGANRWQMRMNGQPRQVVNFGGSPGLFDQVDGLVAFHVFHLADGSPAQEIAPACPNEPFPNDPQEPGIYDRIIPMPDGNGAIFIAGFFEPGCAQRWLPGQEAPAWETTFDSALVRASLEEILLTQDALYIVYGSGAYAIDLADGAFSTLHTSEDYTMIPLAARDGVLAVLAERTRGTSRWEIWGLDAALGNVKWTFVTETARPLGETSSSLFSDGVFTAGLTSGGITVAQMFDEPARITLQTIPLQSGTASAPVTYALPDRPGILSIDLLGWRGDELWLFVEETATVLDVRTGEILRGWP